MAVRAPTDKRFRRARVKPVRRSRVWLRRAVAASRQAFWVVLLLVAGTRAYALATTTSILSIEHVEVTGARRLSRGEVNALVDGLSGRNVLLVNLDAWRDRLLAAPWVKDAQLRRVFPSTVSIALIERQPIGLARLGPELYLVDGDGVVIDEYAPRYADFDLPVVDGLSVVARETGLLVDPARAELAGRVVSDLERARLLGRVSEVDVSDVRDAVVILSGDPPLLRLGTEHFAERLGSYLELAPRLRAHVPEIEYVDLRYGERVYVRPAKGRGSPGRAN
jgi:cell division protein FtsQ